MAPRQRKQGIVKGDRLYHAAVWRVMGSRASCGAGRIHLMLAGAFDPSDRISCPACAEVMSTTGEPSKG